MHDTFLTVEKPSEAIFTDKGSKFIAYIFPIHSFDNYKDCLLETKTLHPKAGHHCWALRYSKDRNIFKLSDDGEPSGSAGRPILNCLLSTDITNVCAIVVRYFGGTLLGVPGLINAYKTSTQMAIERALICTRIIEEVYRLQFKYEQINNVMRIIKENRLIIIQQELDNTCSIEIAIRKSALESLIPRFKNINSLTINFSHTA